MVFSSCTEKVQSDIYNVGGRVTLCQCGTETVTLTLASDIYGTVEILTDTEGNYTFDKVWKGTYVVTPRREGYTFYPASREITISDSDIELVDFDTITSWEISPGTADKNGEAFSVVQTPDCGFLISGYRDVSVTGTENLDMWLIKTDLYGNIVWQDTHGNSNYPDIAYSAVYDSEGNIVVGGYSDSVNAGSFNIIKYVADGSENGGWTMTGGWERFYGTDLLPDRPAYIFETADSGYFTGGYSGGTAGNLEDVYGISLDNDGDQLITPLAYGLDDSEKSNAADMILRDPSYTGGFIIAGETKDSSGFTRALLLKRDSVFGVAWNRFYIARDPLTEADCYFTSFNSVKETGDSGYICAGTVKKSSVSTRDIYILKTDTNGDEQWSRLIDNGADDFNGLAVLTADGGYAIGATCMSLTGTIYRFTLIKLSNTGNIEWQKEFDAGNSDNVYLRSIVQTYDGGYALCGVKTTSSGKKQVFLIKTDRNGDLPLKQEPAKK